MSNSNFDVAWVLLSLRSVSWSNSPQGFPELSSREREILQLLAQGYKNAEIADSLVVSPKTVRNHVSNIISKLQVTDHAQAILRAKEAGLGT